MVTYVFGFLAVCVGICYARPPSIWDACDEDPGKVGTYSQRNVSLTRYSYHTDINTCVKFNYGGQDGNANNFLTLQDCKGTCVKPRAGCKKELKSCPPSTSSRYVYDWKTNLCTMTKCREDKRSFYDEKSCLDQCAIPKEVCNARQVTPGICFMDDPSYTYDKKNNKCIKLNAQCDTTPNKFLLKEQCENTCLAGCIKELTSCSPSTFPRYVYDWKTNLCTTKKCREDKRSFTDEKSCLNQCAIPKDACDEDPGKIGTYSQRNVSFTRYSYHTDTNNCVKFDYGGQDGNKNNFLTQQACKGTCVKPRAGCIKELHSCPLSTPPRYVYDWKTNLCTTTKCRDDKRSFNDEKSCLDECAIPKEVCNARQVKPNYCLMKDTSYTYDKKRNRCYKIDAQCDYTPNKFLLKEQCENTCLDPCREPMGDTGQCKAAIPKYTFNFYGKKCEQFSYGGCGGNNNRFDKLEDCKSACIPDPCSEPMGDTGHCKGAIAKYTFNFNGKKCEQFSYGGCGGNNNRFDKLEDCKRACIPDPCSEPMGDTGKCKAAILKYTFNFNGNRCEQFSYGGCDGNNNRFDKLDDCKRACIPDQCRDPIAVAGPCQGFFKKFTYNYISNKCEEFTYGGCQGNNNRFDQLETCNSACVQSSRMARCEMLADPSDPDSKRGTITLTQNKDQNVNVKVDLHSVAITTKHTTHERGLHVHEGGDISGGCKGVRGHYNPGSVFHGSRNSTDRHPGDLGNIKCTNDGNCFETFEVTQLSLFGATSVIGRSIVLHGGKDDLGLGENEGSRASGNAGGRIACCEIKLV